MIGGKSVFFARFVEVFGAFRVLIKRRASNFCAEICVASKTFIAFSCYGADSALCAILENMKPEDEPYSLSSPVERQRRLAMLHQAHIGSLEKYLADIKAEHLEKHLPHFDTCDGGVLAKALFLLEAPGPKAVDSAFISRNNPDPTAQNMCRLLREASIARKDTLLWNIVPWYVGDGSRIRAVNKDDIQQASSYLKDLLGLLPNLKVLALVGQKSQSAKSQIQQLTDLPIAPTHHPSARVFNVWPHKKEEMREQLLHISDLINATR